MSSRPSRKLAAAEGWSASSWVARPRATRRPRFQSTSLKAWASLRSVVRASSAGRYPATFRRLWITQR
jgi:hypothetical protein